MKFEIKSAINGCILKVQTDNWLMRLYYRLRYREVQSWSYAYQDDYDNEHEAWQAFLDQLDRYFGPEDSSYKPQRIHTIIKPGNDHPDYDACPECGEHRG